MMQPLKTDHLSLSAQAQQYLLDHIKNGAYQPGDVLPSEPDLAAQLGISRATLREALHGLERQGVLIRRHGVGTFVAPGYGHQLESGLEQLVSTAELAARQGLPITYDALQVRQEAAAPDVAAALQLETDAQVTSVHRIIKVGGEPAAYMFDAIPAPVLSPADIDEAFNGSVLDLLRRKGQPVVQAVADIVALQANAALAKQLNIKRGKAILLIKQVSFGEEGKPVEFSLGYYVPEFFRFFVVRH